MKASTLLIMLLLPTILHTQEAPIKWKEIPMDDMQMTSYGPEPNASAVVLCDYGQIEFNKNPHGQTLFVFYLRHIRIKILNEAGLKYAKVSIPFHDMVCDNIESGNSKVIKGMVYNLDDKGKLKATKLKSRDISYRDSSNCDKIVELAFENVKPGSIIEYYYYIPSLDFLQPANWNFQREIPVRISEFRMKVPKDFEYLISPQNIDAFDINEESFYTYSILINDFKNLYRPSGFNGNTNESNILNLSGKQVRLVKKNIESFSCNGFLNKPEDYMPKLNIHLARVIQRNSTYAWQVLTRSLMITLYEDYDEYDRAQRNSLTYPTSFKVYTLPDWELFNKNLLNSRKFGLPLITFWDYQQHLNAIIDGITNPNEKMLAIYDYIRKNIKWNKEYDNDVSKVHSKFTTKMYTKITHKIIKEKSLAEPFENKTGSNSEINFILIYLLNKAGIDANPVLLSTRDNGKPDQNIPELKQFNHVLALAKIGKEQFLLDATDSLRPFQILDINDLNADGFSVQGIDFGWIPISNNTISETNTQEKIAVDSNMIFTRKTLIQETGYDALKHRKEIAIDGKENFINSYKSQIINYLPDKPIDIKNIENDAYPLVLMISQKQNIGNEKELKIQVNFNPVYNTEDFAETFRKFPVNFTYPFIKTYKLEIAIPDAFVVETPKNEAFGTFGDNASFKYETSLNQNKIELKIELRILKSEFPAHEYSNLANLFTKLNEKLKQHIVIRKVKSIE